MESVSKDILRLLEDMEEMFETATSVPFSSKVMVDKAVMVEIIKDIRLSLPNQVKQADWINNEKQRILDNAEEEAKQLVEKAKEIAQDLVKQEEITQKAEEEARVLVERADLVAQQIKEGSREYALALLGKLTNNIDKIQDIVEKNMKEMEEFDL